MHLLAAPDPRWPQQAQSVINDWHAALGTCLLDCHHIGSTSVPELTAKPILDLLPAVASLTELDAATQAITALGYEAIGEFGLPARRYFRKTDEDGTRLVHVHAYAAGDPSIQRHIAFRDLLRSNSTVRTAYQSLKIAADTAAAGDTERYIDLKNDFIKTHEILALKQFP